MEKKTRYNQSQNKSTQKYLAVNMEQIRFWVKKGEKENVKADADGRGMSMARYLINAVNAYAGKQILTPPKENGQEPPTED